MSRFFIHPLFLAFTSLALSSISYAQEVISTSNPLDEQPGPEYSADQILNGETPGRKESPVSKETFNSDGFAKELLYHVPAPEVHPRILFAPQDIPRIVKQLKETASGRALWADLQARVAKTFDDPKSDVNQAFTALQAGDEAKAQSILDNIKAHPAPGSISNEMFVALQDKALYCLLSADEAEGKKTAALAAKFATFLQPRIDEAAKAPGADDFWRSIRSVCTAGPALAYIYDFSQPYMTKDQADTYRHMLVTATKGRYVLGMDLPHHWRNWNFIGMAEEFPLFALAIEGEEGYDPRIFARGSEVAHDYINYSMSQEGIAKEAVGYHTAGVGHITQLMLAMANRGDNLFTDTRYRNMWDNWFVWAMQPYGGLWESSGDLGTFPPNMDSLMPAKFFFPNDPKLDYVFTNHPMVKDLSAMKSSVLTLLTPADPIEKEGHPVDYQNGAALQMPSDMYDPERGYMFARDAWSKEAVSLQFAARSDTAFVSHDDADRGTFYFSALGLPWSVPSFREVETKYTNCITIDGVGQGYAATPAKWVDYISTPLATFGAVDLSYCYDWRWIKSPLIMSDEELAKKPWLSSYEEPRKRLLDRFRKIGFERDPSPNVVNYFSGYLAGDPRMWDEDSWVVRAPVNPVEYAYRTAGLVRGKRSYALIVDDFKKNDAEHLYEWNMQVPMNVEVYSVSKGDLVIGPIIDKRKPTAPTYSAYRDIGTPLPEKDAPELLVRELSANQPAIPTYQSSPRLETIEYLRNDDSHQFSGRSTGLGKRLVLPSRSVVPDYKVLLFPLKQGEPLPVTTLSDDQKHLTIEWDGQKDEYDFDKGADGRTLITLHRDGQLIFQEKPAGK